MTFDRPAVQERNLNNFVYTVVMNMSKDQKDSLPNHLRRYISTQKRFQSFLEKCSLDQKRELLSYSDLQSFFMICPMGAAGYRETEEVIKYYELGDVQEGLRRAIKANIFVTSKENLAFALGRMSNTMNGIPYIQNLELKRVAEATRKWVKKLAKSDDVEDDSVDTVMRILLWSGINWEQSLSAVGLESDHLKIMHYLYTRRNNFVTKQSIDNFFAGIIPASRIGGIYTILRKAMLIQNQFEDEKVGYKITAKGIRVCNQFRDRILKSINF